MGLKLAVIAACALLAALVTTALVRRHALRAGVLDVPNERSSHRTPTPRGGGIAIVISTTAALLALAGLGILQMPLVLALTVGGALVALAGFVDDRRPLSAGARLAVHIVAAVWALVWLGGLPPLRFGMHDVALGWPGHVLGLLAIVWVLNLFNFMDGIDGIAASEAIFIAWAGALLTLTLAPGAGAAAVVFGAACVGFLCWNWPPARIFMGDVGSGYLGYIISVLAIAVGHQDPPALWVWLILGGVFFVDATVTLIRRSLRGERVYEAHRSHAYQWLARRWASHAKVTAAVLLVNLLWLFPCALLAARWPQCGAGAVLLAFAPLVVLVALTSGRREDLNRSASTRLGSGR